MKLETKNKNNKHQETHKLLHKLRKEILEEKNSEQFQEYMRLLAIMPRYSFNNIMLIHAQKKDATRVASYQAWIKLGRYVTQGQKGLKIIAPIIFAKNNNGGADKKDGQTTMWFKTISVFDVSQTQGAPLPKYSWASEDIENKLVKPMLSILDEENIEVRFAKGLDLYGSTDGKDILVRDGMSDRGRMIK